jgi:GcrA cell cycle regulator
MQWTDERINQLKELWGQGLTASQIAERLGGLSRNAVIGKAHRLGLSSRPSPIRGGAATGPRPARRPRSQPARPGVGGAAPGGTAAGAPVTAEETVPAPTPTPKPARRRARAGGGGGGKACMWPVGDPKEQNFHFCEEPAEPGRPYCASHCAQAYQRRSEEAA